MSSEYEVGKWKPPHRTRFQKGQSGNPSGRPEGSKNKENAATILQKVLGRNVTIIQDGKPQRISYNEALIRSIAAKAIKGDSKAQKFMLDLMKHTGQLDLPVVPDPNNPTGVLVVPATLPPEEWIKMFGNRIPDLKAPAKAAPMDEGPRFLKPGEKP